MDWEGVSEVGFGLVLSGKLSRDAVRPDMFIGPYDRGIQLIQEGNDAIETLITRVGLTAVQAAQDAASQVDGNRVDWIGMLEKAAIQSQLAIKFDRAAKRLRSGEDVDLTEVIEQYNLLDRKEMNVMSMADITPEEESFIPSGWKALDDHFNGLPRVGLIVTGGNPGSGKTSYLAKKAAKFVKTYPTKKALIFTLEMARGEYVKRALEVESVSEDERKRLLVCDMIMPADELANTAARFTDLGFIGIDFSDLLIMDDNSESEMSKIYKTMHRLAKRLEIPVEMLSQLSRFVGGIPRPNHLRWTGLAEALGWEILMVYNPNTDFRTTEDDLARARKLLPPVPDTAYILQWKARGGLKHWMPCAIQVPWDGLNGWGDDVASDPGWFKLTL